MYGLSFAPGGRIVYSSLEGGALALWTMKTDGSDRAVLNSDGSENSEPVASRDGRVFYLARTPSGFEVRRVGLDGTEARALVTAMATEGLIEDRLAVSPDSRWVVFGAFKEGVSRLFRVPAEGGTPQKLTDFPSYLPAVSPDGSRLAFYYLDPKEKRFRIGIVPFDRGGAPVASFGAETPHSGTRLKWTKDGLLINTMPADRANLWLQPLDGSPPKRLTAFEDLVLYAFDVSPDGKTIATARGTFSRDAVLITGFRGQS
jgi:Tol biopolymer transport system component